MKAKRFLCHRCGRINDDYEAFGVGYPTRRTYCRSHIPWYIRFKLWVMGY